MPAAVAADGPSHDLSAWHGVLRGLTVMRTALIAGAWGLCATPILGIITVALLQSFDAWWALWLPFVAIAIYCAAGTAVFLTTIGMCFYAPLEAGARQRVQAAFFLMAIAVALFSAELLIGKLRHQVPAPPSWFVHLTSDLVLEGTIIAARACLALAVICWHLFLRSVGIFFGWRNLAASAKAFNYLFGIWMAGALLLPYLFDPPSVVITGFVAASWLVWIVLVLLGAAILCEARDNLQRTLLARGLLHPANLTR